MPNKMIIISDINHYITHKGNMCTCTYHLLKFVCMGRNIPVSETVYDTGFDF